MNEDDPQRMESIIEGVWQRSLPTLRERLDLLDRASSIQPLPRDLQEQATGIAHKLSGSLGMFGHQEATTIARQIEQRLEANDLGPLPALTARLRQTLFPS